MGRNVPSNASCRLREALPNATFIGFTGTPIELSGKITTAAFGDYIDVYDIQPREGDSNPRYAFTYTRFPGVHLQPLGHLSGKNGRLQGRLFELNLGDVLEGNFVIADPGFAEAFAAPLHGTLELLAGFQLDRRRVQVWEVGLFFREHLH